MASTTANPSRKRKPDDPPVTTKAKKPRPADQPCPQQPTPLPLAPSQEALLETLRKKHNLLFASVISSTKIRHRIARAVEHLSAADEEEGGQRPRVVFLHARPGEVCKMITIAEKTRGLVGGLVQYNQLMEVPAKEGEVVEETVLEGEEEESDDGFEKLEIYVRAVEKPKQVRRIKTLGIYLARGRVLELEGRENVTVQDDEEG